MEKSRSKESVCEEEKGIAFSTKRKFSDELVLEKIYSDKYTDPPIPVGYVYVEGEWSDGVVIKRISDESQFVWIPVGSLKANGTLDGKTFTEKLGRRNYLKDNFSALQYNEVLAGRLFEQINSVKRFGGFYISRYNISKGSDNEPKSVRGAIPWVNISFLEARRIASKMEKRGNLRSHLTYGAEYDSILEWIIESKAKKRADVIKNSSEWGNYSDSKNSPQGLTKTGAREDWCVNHIYDLAGNLDEWTQERFDGVEYVFRGGRCIDDGDSAPVAFRDYGEPSYADKHTGFRVALYIAV